MAPEWLSSLDVERSDALLEVRWRLAEQLDPERRDQFVAGELDGVVMPASALDDVDASAGVMAVVDEWIRTEVARPDARLQRPGPQCPFVPPALSADALYYCAIRVARAVDVDAAVRELASTIFQSLVERHAQRPDLVALVLVFPRMPPPEAAAMVHLHHTVMKSFVVERGQMLGEFTPDHYLPARWNPALNVGWAPAPVLALRNMVRSDHRFLVDGNDEWKAAYEERFGAR